MTSYAEALAELCQAKLPDFVAERKRLSKELKAAGDSAGATRLSQRARPTLSVWTVNQLYWHSRSAFEHLFETAEPLRSGGLSGGAKHREALAKLRDKATTLLEQAGHAPSEATLRRVMTTLSALAATGSFEPDAPGTLSADRDPPGFEAIGIVSDAEPTHSPAREHAPPQRAGDGDGEQERRAAAVERERARREHEAERRRADLERKKQEAERKKLELEIGAERRRLEAREKDVERRRRDLEEAEAARDAAKRAVATLEERLSSRTH